LKTSTTVEPFSARHVASGIDQVEINGEELQAWMFGIADQVRAAKAAVWALRDARQGGRH